MQEAPGYVHMVYFWLKDGITAEEKEVFRKGVHKLSDCKTVIQTFIGPPAMTPREVVDNSYDYALLVFFKNKEDHDAYQTDPDHHVFIDTCKDLWTRVQIYDHLPEA